MPPNTRKKPPIVGLDVIRCLAAFAVLLFHLSFTVADPASTAGRIVGAGSYHFDWANGSTSLGGLGVEIFFVLSGFVISYTADGADSRRFFRSRFLRLFPTALICATLTLSVVLAGGIMVPAGALVIWLRTIAFWPFEPYIDGAFWTLGIECSFYVMVLALLAFDKGHHLVRLAWALAVMSAAYWIIGLADPTGQVMLHSHSRLLKLALVVHGVDFAAGIFLWRIMLDRPTAWRLAGLGLALFGGAIEVAHATGFSADTAKGLAVWFVSVGAICGSVAWNGRIVAMIGARGARLFRVIGVTTYPLYLVHQVIGAELMRQLHSLAIGPLGALLITILAMVVLAVLVATWIEPPIRAVFAAILDRLMARLSERRTPRSGAVR